MLKIPQYYSIFVRCVLTGDMRHTHNATTVKIDSVEISSDCLVYEIEQSVYRSELLYI